MSDVIYVVEKDLVKLGQALADKVSNLTGRPLEPARIGNDLVLFDPTRNGAIRVDVRADGVGARALYFGRIFYSQLFIIVLLLCLFPTQVSAEPIGCPSDPSVPSLQSLVASIVFIGGLVRMVTLRFSIS
jgi:hypothetical protein